MHNLFPPAKKILCSLPTRIFTNTHPLTKIRVVKYHTSVCTICGLCSLKLFTAWNTSRSPSAFTRSRILLSAMNVPVLPAPALQRKHTWLAHSRIKMLKIILIENTQARILAYSATSATLEGSQQWSKLILSQAELLQPRCWQLLPSNRRLWAAAAAHGCCQHQPGTWITS